MRGINPSRKWALRMTLGAFKELQVCSFSCCFLNLISTLQSACGYTDLTKPKSSVTQGKCLWETAKPMRPEETSEHRRFHNDPIITHSTGLAGSQDLTETSVLIASFWKDEMRSPSPTNKTLLAGLETSGRWPSIKCRENGTMLKAFVTILARKEHFEDEKHSLQIDWSGDHQLSSQLPPLILMLVWTQKVEI